MQIRSTGWDKRKWSTSVLLAQRPPAFLKNPERVRGVVEEEGAEGKPGERDGGGGQREKIYNGQMGDKRFEDEGGAREQR